MSYNDRGNYFKGRSNDRGSFGAPREMYKAICSDCGVETEVPFKPTEGRPIYCRECLPKHRPPRENRTPRENRRY